MKVAKSLLSAALLAAPLALGQASVAVGAPLGAPAIQHEALPDTGILLARDGRGHGGGQFHGGGRPHFGGRPHYGGHGYFPGRHFGRFGPGIGFGVPYYYYGPGYYYGPSYYYDDDFDDDVGPYDDDAVARCQARYRSFDAESGTFLGNDGARHPCPYLE